MQHPIHQAIPAPAEAEALHQTVARQLRQHRDKSGFYLLHTGAEAFAYRLALIQASKQQLDLQYYILQDDLTGKLLVEELLRAADRGVRIRILLDDLDFGRAKESVRLLEGHAQVEVRIFNPATTRRKRLLNQLFRFSRFFERYSKRMHNKALIADGALAVMGGRNLGDEYFDARAEFAFNDLDVLAIGPVVEAMNGCFQEYWQADAAHELQQLSVSALKGSAYDLHRLTLRRFYEDIAHRNLISTCHPHDVLRELAEGEVNFAWAEAEFYADSPDKVFTPLKEATSPPMDRLAALLEQAKREFVVVSPYFIPGREGMAAFEKLAGRGVQVKVLTNSLASTDISAVHAVYSRYRTHLLRRGVQLFELKPVAGARKRSNLLRKAASRSSLHAKAYVIDRDWVMIGSMNLDPRSWKRNTETMIALRNPQMAREILQMFDATTTRNGSFELRLKERIVEWVSEEHGKLQRYHSDPKPGWLRRILFHLFYHLAPEDQL